MSRHAIASAAIIFRCRDGADGIQPTSVRCCLQENRTAQLRRGTITAVFRYFRDLWQEAAMNGIIYLIGLIVVILAILSFFGLR